MGAAAKQYGVVRMLVQEACERHHRVSVKLSKGDTAVSLY